MNFCGTSRLRVVALAIFMLGANLSMAYKVRDARGVEFEFSKPPTCVTVVPAVTQNLFAIGAGDLLIANSKFCDYPQEAKSKIKIGGFIDPDYEKIVELNPDIVVVSKTQDGRIERRLEKLGVKCFVLNGEGLNFISQDIRLLGKLTGKIAEAEKVASEFESIISADSIEIKKRRAIFMFGRMAAGKGSFVGDIIEKCGLENCAKSTGLPWAEVSREFVLSVRPEIIFAEIVNDTDKTRLEKFFRTDPIWSSTDAVKKSAIFFVPRLLVVVPSVRVAEAIKLMREYCSNLK